MTYGKQIPPHELKLDELVTIRYTTTRGLEQWTGPVKFSGWVGKNVGTVALFTGKRSFHLYTDTDDAGGMHLSSLSFNRRPRRINDDLKPVTIFKWITT